MKKRIFVLVFLYSVTVGAAEIVMVQGDFPMENKSLLQHPDVYINHLYKVGEILAVARKVPIETPDRTQRIDSINVPFCLIKILFSEGNISIGRMVYLKEAEELPHIKIYSPMVGDKVLKPEQDLLDAYIGGKKTSSMSTPKGEIGLKQSQVPRKKEEEEAFQILL